MNLMLRRDPFSLFDDMFDAMANRAGYVPARTGGTEGASLTRARLDVVERGDNYEVKVDLPGVKKDDIQIDLDGSHVSISAASRVERDVKNGDRVLYTERQSAQYMRSFELPQPVSEDGADASFEDGVLTLTLPKRQEPQGRRLAVR